MSDPKAHGTKLAATAAALPPDDPPGTLFKFHGFLVIWIAEFSVELPIANSSMFSFPNIGMFFSLIFVITVASYGDTKFSNIFEEHVVLIPFVQILSLIPIGIPASGFFDSAIASSKRVLTNAATSGSFSLILAAYAFVISSIVISLFFTFSINS